eukprot:3883694-Amphidinium_carterae.1
MSQCPYKNGKSAVGQNLISATPKMGDLVERTCGAVCAIGKVTLSTRWDAVAAAGIGHALTTWSR